MGQEPDDTGAVKPTTSTLRKSDDDGMESRFTGLCKSNLGLDETAVEEATTLFKACKPIIGKNMLAIGTGSPDEMERHLSAFTLYCVAKLGKGNKNNEGRLNLSRILKTVNLSITDFFKEIPQLMLKAAYTLNNHYGSDWEKRLEVTEVQANVVHLRVLSNYYKRAYEEFFLPTSSSNGKESVDSGYSGFISEYHRFGWLLFLALRVHAFSRFRDLVTSTNGLVSILAFLILHIPARFRKFTLPNSTQLVKKTDKGLNLIASLCEIYHTSEDDLKAVLEKVNNLIIEILNKSPHPAAECKTENLNYFDPAGLLYFTDLMEEESLRSSLLILEKDYDDAVHSNGGLDERLFVDDEDSLFGSGSLSGGAMHLPATKRKFDTMASPSKSITSPLSPPRSPTSPGNSILGRKNMLLSPVSTAMTTAKWLRTAISPLSSKPSPDLERFLSSCDRNVTTEVVQRANIILEAIFPSRSMVDLSLARSMCNSNIMDRAWAGERKMEALKLYYSVLEAMCRAESLLHGSNLTCLLSNDRFHRCMLACSSELILATHKTVTTMFPAVLERTGITAFDLSKVIESFIRHEETLPRELKRHLNALEERLIESLAWEKGSSMYNSLIVAKPALSAEVLRLGLLAEPMPSLDAIAMRLNIPTDVSTSLRADETFAGCNEDICSPKKACNKPRSTMEHNFFSSPVKNQTMCYNSPKSKLRPLQSAFATPTRPNPAGGGETCAETGIAVFFSKICKLAAIRIKILCEKLQLSSQIQEPVYTLLQQILNQRTFLFFNRHIDQLILCSLYGVAKISHLSLTFKEIINCYKKLPHCKPQVFRSVYVDRSLSGHNVRTGQEHVDIITFYNGVFIPSVKPLLVEVGAAGSALRTNRASDGASIADGQSPGSPRFSPFPSLPDMSPKKVSATHNVYVSPLRTSKVDALLSPSSRSYYACVGESTHAYQSPSKDLAAINYRIKSSGRKVRLDFDMVSDSLVAGSLGSRTDSSSTCPSSVPVLQTGVKCEQPDS